MSRYARDFAGIPSEFTRPTGMDPNYRDGYRGQRMLAGGGRAAYGAHRLDRSYDLDTAGGFAGIHREDRVGPGPRYRPDWEESGGVRGAQDARLLGDFNAHTPRLREGGRAQRGRELDRSADARRTWAPQREYDPGYTNRGVMEAGFSEGWARGPMRGSR